MSIRSTTEEFEVPLRNRYGTEHETKIVDIHVFMTITHDVVGLEIWEHSNDSGLALNQCEVILTHEETKRLAQALLNTIKEVAQFIDDVESLAGTGRWLERQDRRERFEAGQFNELLDELVDEVMGPAEDAPEWSRYNAHDSNLVSLNSAKPSST